MTNTQDFETFATTDKTVHIVCFVLLSVVIVSEAYTLISGFKNFDRRRADSRMLLWLIGISVAEMFALLMGMLMMTMDFSTASPIACDALSVAMAVSFAFLLN